MTSRSKTERPLTSLARSSLTKASLAGAWLLAITTSMALADDPAVQIYGHAHVTADILDNGTDSGFNVSSNSSRLGFRANTDLGEGLKGIFQIESTISYDNGSGSVANRDSFVGLEGAFGGVRLGYFDTPLKKVRSRTDFFGDQIGDARNLTRLGSNAGSPFDQDFDIRLNNGIHYYTPSLGGFVLDVHYSSNTTTSTNPEDDAHSAASAAGTYMAGNLYLALAYETQEAREDSNAIRLGAKYKIGDWTIGGLIQQASIETLDPAEVVQTYGVGASYKLTSKTTIKGQVYALSAKDRDHSDATLFALGADHALSKQFRLLFAYAMTDNEENAAYRVTGIGYGDSLPTTVGETASGLSAGFRYDF